MRQFKRADRVRNQILRDVRELLEGELSSKLTGMVTFTDVEVTNDLRYATIYFSYLGTEAGRDQAENYLTKIRGRVQGQLGRMMSIKFFPEIKFKFDSSIEQGIKIQRLLNDIADGKQVEDDGNS